MKQSGMTIIFVIVCIAVLIGSWGIGLCIRQVRFRSAGIESKAGTEPEMSADIQKPADEGKPESKPAEMTQVRPEAGPMPDMGGMGRMLSEEDRARMRERWENMSEEEREQEREKRMAEMRKRKEQFENMSEEEREKFRAEMREKFGGRRRQGGRRRPEAERQENNLE